MLNKNILVVSSWSPPRPGGSAQHLYNFFSQFEQHTYALYTREENMRVDEPGPRLPCTYYFFPHTHSHIRIFRTILNAIRSVHHALRIIKTNRFDALYTTSDGGGALLLGSILSALTRVPLVLHFFDIYRGNSLPLPWSGLAWAIEPVVLMRARIAIFPNEAIHEEYCRRYRWMRNKFFCINNGTFEDRRVSLVATQNTHLNPPYHIVVTGSVYWAQEESALCLARAVHGTPDLLADFYVPRHVPQQFSREIAENSNACALSAPPAAMAHIQTAADLLFVPLAQPGKSPIVTMTAVPGKLPEYLLAGRPIIVQAPEGSFMAQYAHREGFAHVVTSYNPLHLRDEMRRVIADPAYQDRLIKNALSTFHRFHDARKNATRIAELLNSLPTKRHVSHNQHN